MAKGRVAGRGRARTRLVLVLLGFLAIAVGVILRRTYGIATASQLQQLESRRAALVAERLRIEADIRNGSSRAVIQPIAEHRLQMHLPSTNQVIIIPRTPARHDAP